MRSMLSFIMVLSTLCLTGCSMFGDAPNKDYLKAHSYPGLAVPPMAKAPNQQPFYAIDAHGVTGQAGQVSLLPPGSLASRNAAKGIKAS